MIPWRREPFRLFFPLGILIGVVGVLPWLLFGRGFVHAWPGLPHALTMTQGLLGAIAVGFLGTLLPRRTTCQPMSVARLGLLAVLLIALPVAIQLGSLLVTELVFLAIVVTLGSYVLGALRGPARRPAPPSFVLLPLGVGLGVAGAILLIVSDLGIAGSWAVPLGRQLAHQGMILGMLLAIGPMLAPILAHGEPRPDAPPARARRERALHLLAGMALAASFPLELWWSARLGLLLRGLVCVAELVGAGGLWRPGTRMGLHRWFFRVSLWAVPLGLLAASLAPERRVQLLHVTYIGGLSLVAFAISSHVTLLHTGHAALADRRPVLVALAGGTMLAAALVRIGAENAGHDYVFVITLAAVLWLVSAVAWAAFLAPRLFARSRS
jgi:uncharacterized protein involved in response to NO